MFFFILNSPLILCFNQLDFKICLPQASYIYGFYIKAIACIGLSPNRSDQVIYLTAHKTNYSILKLFWNMMFIVYDSEWGWTSQGTVVFGLYFDFKASNKICVAVLGRRFFLSLQLCSFLFHFLLSSAKTYIYILT